MQKELIRSEDLYSRGWAICRLRAQDSRFHDSLLPCGARGVRESRKFCSRKQPAATFKKHRIKPAQLHDDRLHHFLLLGCFVLFQRNRKRTAVDRPGAVAAKCETSRTSGRAAQSTVKTSGTAARDCFAFHKCGRHPRPAPADASIGSLIPIFWICYRVSNCVSRISSSAFSPPQVAFSTISVPGSGAPCRYPGIHLDPFFTAARIRRMAGPVAAARSRVETCPALCGPRRTKADHNPK